MAMMPYMAAGYAADRMMGGDGKIGLAAGTGFGGFSTGAFGSALGSGAAETASTGIFSPTLSIPELAGTTGVAGTEGMAALNSPSILSGTGGFNGSEMVTGMSNAGLMGANTVPSSLLGAESLALSQATPGSFELMKRGLGTNIDSLMNNPVTDLIGQGTDYIDEGYKNMSVGDTMTAGMLGSQAIDALNPPPPEGQIMNIPQVASKGSTPRQSTQANPLAITVPGNELSREDLKKLYEERMYG
mgnify:FL=1